MTGPGGRVRRPSRDGFDVSHAAARLDAAMGFRPVTGAGEFTHVLELVPRSG